MGRNNKVIHNNQNTNINGAPSITKGPIFFFDGLCNLCNAMVDLSLRFEKKPDIMFSSLQSGFAQDFLKNYDVEASNLATAYFYKNGKVYTKAQVPIQLSGYLKFPLNMLGLLQFVPEKLRDILYDFVAQRRYAIFGKRESCRVATEAERLRFLE